ncbi:MAG: response regulator, partial [Anaerolineaceae bacterium]|nr:response regulator [Anaerolineaceae bacterium]
MSSEKLRVLVTDDEEELTILMGLSLRKAGFDVDTACDGFESLEKIENAIAEENPFVVLVTDQMMPGMNGQELLRKARELDNTLEVIMVTAAGSLKSAISAMREDGAYDYLLKPLESMRQLNMAVERAAAHRQLLKERQGLQQRIGLMLANTGDAIISADEKGDIEFINQAALQLCRKTGLQGTNALQNLPETLGQLIKNWRSAGSSQPAMVEINWSDHTVQMVQLNGITGENGEARGWIMILRDVTHLKQLDEMRTKMLSSVANQVRAPLAEAMNHLVKLNLLTAHDEEIGEIISRLTQIWGHIHKWGSDLSDVVAIGNAPEPHLEMIDLHTVLSPNRLKPTELLVKKWGCKMIMQMEDNLPKVHADPDLLIQLLKGLINRAVSRSSAHGEVKISTRQQEEQVWIDITDEGPPVEKTDLPY